ncbi:MAG: endosialidase [Blautia sp.]|nr:endosialidase [Blautia sp.]
MSSVKELIRAEENGTLSFGDYELETKTKLTDFGFQGDLYKVKTFRDITKLERNGMFVYESTPGTAVYDLTQDGNGMSFKVEGPSNAQITVELAAQTPYEVWLDEESTGTMTTNLGGKLSFSVELENAPDGVEVRIRRSATAGF